MSEQRILIVDDSRVILQMIRKVLDDTGYEVYSAESGEEALDLIKKRGLPHLALIDINMSGMNGFTLCEKIHRFSDLPIIMITSEDSEEMVVEGLQYHAEDYVIKPIRKKEIVARVERVLRRMGDFGYTLSDPTITVDKRLQVRLAHREIVLDGETVKLTPIEAKFLYILMRHAGRTVSTEYILRRIWPNAEAYEDRLHAAVYRLRRKMEANPKEPVYIVSDWSKGYIFPESAG